MSVPSMPRRRCESGHSGRSHGGKAGTQLPSCQSGKMEKKPGTASEEQGQKMRASRGCPLWPDQVLHCQGRKLSRPMRSCVDSVKKRPTFSAPSYTIPEGAVHVTPQAQQKKQDTITRSFQLTETLISLHPDNKGTTIVYTSPARVPQQRAENRPARPRTGL